MNSEIQYEDLISSYKSVGNVQGWIASFLTQLKIQLKENAFLVVFCVLSYACAYLVSFALDFPLDNSMTGYLKRGLFGMTPILIYLYLVLTALKVILIERPKSPVKAYINTIWPSIIDPRRFARVVPLLLIATLGFFAFVQFKLMIPKIIPFYGDAAFISIDKFIHFGRLPSEWLMPLINSEWAVDKLDFAYKLWYLPMFLIWVWAAWGAEDNGWRRQYVLAFILCWILGGSILATLLSSVGPCFVEPVLNTDSPYSLQMATLHSYHANQPLLAVSAQNLLLEGYLHPDETAIRSGISAMPSMHNALAMLFAIAAYKINRPFGHAMLAFAIIILIGSVVLGWHYAIDGYVGFLVAVIMWKLAGWILKKQDSLLKINPHPAAH